MSKAVHENSIAGGIRLKNKTTARFENIKANKKGGWGYEKVSMVYRDLDQSIKAKGVVILFLERWIDFTLKMKFPKQMEPSLRTHRTAVRR